VLLAGTIVNQQQRRKLKLIKSVLTHEWAEQHTKVNIRLVNPCIFE